METLLIAIAIALRLAAGIGYLTATIKGTVQPSVVSWFFWGFTALIAFAVQIQEHAGIQALSTLALGISPVAVFIIAAYKQKNSIRFTRVDKVTATIALLGVLLWLVTKDPMMALFFSITADFVSGIPTIIKSIKDPGSERAVPYLLSLLSMVCALAAIQEWTAAAFAFPLYILCINLVFFTLIASRIGPRTRKWWSSRRPLVAATSLD